VRKISTSQSVPVDWRKKDKEISARIHEKIRVEDVDVIVNADKMFLLFHPFGDKLLAPTGAKHVGLAVQVDNEKWGATVMIACKYRTSSILPPMIIFTGVYCDKLMTQWTKYPKGNFADCFFLILLHVTEYLPSFLISFSRGSFQQKPLDDIQHCHYLPFILNEYFPR